MRKVWDGEQDYELFGFLTTSPNEIVSPIHEKAMLAILTTPEEVDTWLMAPWDEARHLQRPLLANMLVIVPPQAKPKPDEEGLLLFVKDIDDLERGTPRLKPLSEKVSGYCEARASAARR